MKSTLDVQDGLSRKLNIEVPTDQVQQAFTKVYSGIQKNVEIKGFRKGKAPLAQVKSLFKERVTQDVLEDLVNEAFRKAVDEHSLDPVGQPNLHFGSLDEHKNFSFTAEFEVRPEIKIKQTEKLKVEKEILKITDAEVEKVLENFRAARAETVPVLEDRAAQMNDVVTLDFFGRINGEPLAGGAANDFDLELGSNSFIPGFEEALVGMRIGGKSTIKLSFPADYHNTEVAGKPVDFEVTIKKLQKKSLPELNDEFAKAQGPYESLTDLKGKIRQSIEEQENERVNEDLRNRFLKVLVAQNPVEVPKTLVKKQKERLVVDMANRMRQQGMTETQFNEYRDKWEKDFETTAREIVQSAFIVDYLADEFKLRATKEQVEVALNKEAMKVGIDPARFREFYQEPERFNNFAFKVTETNVVDHLLAKADVKEVEASKLPEAKK